MDEHCKYALVIQDFHTGDPIDLLRSRRVDVTEPYFVSIPTEERNAVKYLISDMYNQYISYVDKYFPNAVPVVDSFHVIQWIIRLIDNYIRQLLKKYRKRDKEKEEQLSIEFQKPVSLPPSDEVYLLKKYKWLILRNQSFRELKERYVQFNARNAGKPVEARKELDELILLYNASKHEIFREFGSLLEKYKEKQKSFH